MVYIIMNQLECLEENASVPVMILIVMMKKAKYPLDNLSNVSHL